MESITQRIGELVVQTTEIVNAQTHGTSKKTAWVDYTGAVADLQRLLGLANPKDGNLNPMDCLIASCDVEKWTREHRPVTELGIPVIDTRNLMHLPETATLEQILAHTKHHHFRMRESGFYRNDAKYLEKNGKRPPDHYNQAENFQFGKSEWIRADQIESAVRSLLHVPDDKRPGLYRKVVMITHAGNGDMTSISEAAKPQFDMQELVDEEIELQDLAKDAVEEIRDAYGPNDKPGLHKIMEKLGYLNPVIYDANIVHNAGNDATFQLFCAFKIAYDEHRQGKTLPVLERDAQITLNALMRSAISAQGQAVSGTFSHCLKCNRTGHNKDVCRQRNIYCQKCCARDDHVEQICHEWDDAFGRLKRVRRKNYRAAQAKETELKAGKNTNGHGGHHSNGRGGNNGGRGGFNGMKAARGGAHGGRGRGASS